jgi:hypothetical protein
MSLVRLASVLESSWGVGNLAELIHIIEVLKKCQGVLIQRAQAKLKFTKRMVLRSSKLVWGRRS